MATRRYKISPGLTEFSIIEEVGAANNSHVVELTVDLGATLVKDGNAPGAQRTLVKDEVLDALDKFKNYILSHQWPPA